MTGEEEYGTAAHAALDLAEFALDMIEELRARGVEQSAGMTLDSLTVAAGIVDTIFRTAAVTLPVAEYWNWELAE